MVIVVDSTKPATVEAKNFVPKSRGLVYLAALVVALVLALGATVGSAKPADAYHFSYCEGPGGSGFINSYYFNWYEYYGYECFQDPLLDHYTYGADYYGNNVNSYYQQFGF